MAEKLTLDTNLLLEYWKEQTKRHVVQELLTRQRAGSVELAVTARVREDVPSEPLAGRINALPELGIAETGSVTRLGYWVLGRDHLGSDAFNDAMEALRDWRPRKGRPPDWRDHDHLHAHYLLHRDVFLTWDGPLLELGAKLADRLELRVMAPEDYLAAANADRSAS